MSSTWKPSEGLQRAELLVSVLEAEAPAAGAKITAVFRHRMVEQIARVIDMGAPSPANGLLHGQLTESLTQLTELGQLAVDSVVKTVAEAQAAAPAVAKPAKRKPGRPPKNK